MKTLTVILLGLFTGLSAQAKSEFTCTGSAEVVQVSISDSRMTVNVQTPLYSQAFTQNDCTLERGGGNILIRCFGDRDQKGRAKRNFSLSYDFNGRQISDAGISYGQDTVYNDGPEHTGVYVVCK